MAGSVAGEGSVAKGCLESASDRPAVSVQAVVSLAPERRQT